MSLDDAEDLKILEALAKIEDVGDFRLREFMPQLGLNPNQPVEFYRALIKAAREIVSFVKLLEETIDSQAKAQAQLGAKDEQIKALGAKLRSLQDGTHLKSESLEKEKQSLLATTSELQAKVLRYDAIIQLLVGELKPHTLKALSDLYFDMYTEALNAVIYGQSPPDPAVLEKVRQELRQELRDMLRIPQEELEQEMDKLQAKNVELQKNNTALAIAYGVLRQQGWVDTSPGETE